MKNRVTSLPEDRTASQLYRANHFDLCCESRSANESIKLLVRADGFKLRRRVAVHGRALNKRHSSSLFSRVGIANADSKRALRCCCGCCCSSSSCSCSSSSGEDKTFMTWLLDAFVLVMWTASTPMHQASDPPRATRQEWSRLRS